MELNLRPSPVRVTVPTIKPAPAQVAAIANTPVDPEESALVRFELYSPEKIGSLPLNQAHGMMAVSSRNILEKADTTVAQNTDITGEKPNIMNTTMEIREKKWNQYFFVRDQALSAVSK